METDFVAWLVSRLPADPRLEVPPGDDAAVLRPPALRRTVITVDMLMEGIDFILGPDCSPQAVGHKALAVSLSDLAAMGARPEAAVVAVALPRHGGDALGRGIQAGLEGLAAEHGVVLAGGDTNAWDGPLVISTTVLGSVAPGAAWRRDGARPGDLLVVTGAFGGSLLGRHLDVKPRVKEALFIAQGFPVHAAIDCSDGLTLDLARMMAASGTRGVVRLAEVPIHPDAIRRAACDVGTPLDRALGDGEDFELILALPPDAAHGLVAAAGTPPLDLPITVIGTVEEGAGLVAEAADGSRSPLEPRGFVHDFDS
jgi:thiamine-monophosphate kinase